MDIEVNRQIKQIVNLSNNNDELIERLQKFVNDLLIMRTQKLVNVDQLVSPTEPTFTQKQILQLVREELQEAFEDDYAPEELKDKIYTVHGYIIGAIRRGEVRR